MISEFMKHNSQKFGRRLASKRKDLNQISSSKNNKEVRKKEKYTRDFEEFWKVYPRKIQKKTAFRSWRKIEFNSELTQEKIINSVKDHTEHVWSGRTKEWIPYPSKFLNMNKW